MRGRTTAPAPAADDMSEATEKIAEKLTEAPPPGKVKLGDLSPGSPSTRDRRTWTS